MVRFWKEMEERGTTETEKTDERKQEWKNKSKTPDFS